MENKPTAKRFSAVTRARSFAHAWRGVRLFFKTAHSAWLQCAVLFAAVLLGLFFGISQTEWMFVLLSAGFVLAAEAFNTAIEIDIDLTSPEYHPYARDTKDVAAGAVLISSCTALAIGLFIFVPYFLGL